MEKRVKSAAILVFWLPVRHTEHNVSDMHIVAEDCGCTIWWCYDLFYLLLWSEWDEHSELSLSVSCCVDKITQRPTKSEKSARVKKNSSNHKGVKDTLCYYDDMIVCCAFGGMLATKRFFRTISTPINDNNGIRGANQPMKYPQNQGISV